MKRRQQDDRKSKRRIKNNTQRKATVETGGKNDN